MKKIAKTPKSKRRRGMATPLKKSDIIPFGLNTFQESKYAKARKPNFTKPKRRKK